MTPDLFHWYLGHVLNIISGCKPLWQNSPPRMAKPRVYEIFHTFAYENEHLNAAIWVLRTFAYENEHLNAAIWVLRTRCEYH